MPRNRVVFKKFFKNEIKNFHYITNMTTTKHNKHYSGDHEIYNFGITFFGFHYTIVNMVDLFVLSSREESFK